MSCSHLHVELLIKNHESLNLKVHTNGCFVVSVKQISTVSRKEKEISYCQLNQQQLDRTVHSEAKIQIAIIRDGESLATGNNPDLNYVMDILTSSY